MIRKQTSERQALKSSADQGLDERSPDGSQTGIQSLEVGLKLLTLLAEQGTHATPPMLKTISAAAQMAPANVHRYMVSMVRMGYAERDPATGRYRLGPMARQVGVTALRRLDAVRVAAARLQDLCSAVQHSVALSIWTVQGPVVVATEDLLEPVTVSTRVGQTLPMLGSATGQVFGAWLPTHITERLVVDALAKASARSSVRTREQLRALFAIVGRSEPDRVWPCGTGLRRARHDRGRRGDFGACCEL
jgi:DNA-binding IclR family transcriptional regulator